jgi:hypothetical protein
MLLRTVMAILIAASWQIGAATNLAAAASGLLPGGSLAMPSSGTAALVLDGNRIYAEVVLIRPDGTLRKAMVFVDLGSPSMAVSPALFRELHLDRGKAVALRVGEMAVSVDAPDVTSDDWLPYHIGGGREVEAVLPAGVLQRYQVEIDYGRRTLTLAQPGTLHPEGIRVPVRVNAKTGLAAVDVRIDGKPYAMTIDCGSAYTWLTKSAAREWPHPDWERGTGAVGLSNMRMADDGIEATGALMRIPVMELGDLRIPQVGALAIGPGTGGSSTGNEEFMDWYSKKNATRVIGWLGGNILRGFRITIDYPNRVSYWLSESALDAEDLDQVGLTLMFKDGGYFVAGVATKNGRRAVEGVEVGDKLLQVDDLPLSKATWGAIFAAMHGKPGETRVLRLEHNGRGFTVRAQVTRF